MRFTLLFFLVLGSALVFADKKVVADGSPEAVVEEKKPAAAKKEEIKIETVKENDEKKKTQEAEIKKVEKEEVKVPVKVAVVVSSTVKAEEEEKEGVIANVVNTVVKVTKTIANKVKDFFGIEKSEEVVTKTVNGSQITTTNTEILTANKTAPSTAAPLPKKA